VSPARRSWVHAVLSEVRNTWCHHSMPTMRINRAQQRIRVLSRCDDITICRKRCRCVSR
jgi:hypothetical protein